jgi:cytochrome P450
MSERWDLMSAAIRANPYPIYAQMRKANPICQVDPSGRWVVARASDIRTVLRNPALFSSTAIRASSQPAWLGRHNPFADSMLVWDPPQHTRLRTLVNHAFNGAAVNGLEPKIRAIAVELGSSLPQGTSFDFVEAFSTLLPAKVLSGLLGLDPAHYRSFRRWADDIVGIGAITAEDTARHKRVRETVDDMERYFGDVLRERRQQAGDDLVSDLVRASVDDQSLTDDEIIGFLYLLLTAGLETTVHLLSLSIMILADRPDVLERLRAAPPLIGRFLEEVLRYEPPVHGAVRVTTRDVELSGVKLPANTPLVTLIGSACRDETLYSEPDRFVIEREGPTNIAFGAGPHFCLGARLARAEARIALEVLLPSLAAITRDRDKVTWNKSMITRGPASLPITIVV